MIYLSDLEALWNTQLSLFELCRLAAIIFLLLIPHYLNNLFTKWLFPVGNHYQIWGNLKSRCSLSGPLKTDVLLPHSHISMCPLWSCPHLQHCHLQWQWPAAAGEKAILFGGKLQEVELANAWAQFAAVSAGGSCQHWLFAFCRDVRASRCRINYISSL